MAKKLLLPGHLLRKKTLLFFVPARKLLQSRPHVPSGQRGKTDLTWPSLSQTRVFPKTGWHDIDASIPVDEEIIPTYKLEKFYSVNHAQVFNHRYQVVSKLGYGSSAKV